MGNDYPTLYEAMRMNVAAYETKAEPVNTWTPHEEDPELGIRKWIHKNGNVYIAISGTRATKNDVKDVLRIFFGEMPEERMERIHAWVREHAGNGNGRRKISFGGHSSGGLIAATLSIKHDAPALVQNAPGFIQADLNPPQGQTNRITEIVSILDPTANWGSGWPRINLYDPEQILDNAIHCPGGKRQLHLLRENHMNLAGMRIDELEQICCLPTDPRSPATVTEAIANCATNTIKETGSLNAPDAFI